MGAARRAASFGGLDQPAQRRARRRAGAPGRRPRPGPAAACGRRAARRPRRRAARRPSTSRHRTGPCGQGTHDAPTSDAVRPTTPSTPPPGDTVCETPVPPATMTRVFARVGRAVAHHPRLTVVGVAGLRRARLRPGRPRRARGEPVRPAEHGRARRSRVGELRGRSRILDEADDSGPSLTLVLDGVDPADPEVATALAPGAGGPRRRSTASSRSSTRWRCRTAPPTRPPRPCVAQDGDGFLVVVELAPDLSADGAGGGARRGRGRACSTIPADLEAAAPGRDRASSAGTTLIVEAITDQVETDLRTGETIALPIALLIMVLVFGGFLAAGDADGRRDRVDRRRPRGAPGLLLRARPRLVRRQHRDRARPRALDRLGPADGVAVPRGAAPPGRRRRRAPGADGDAATAPCSPRSSAPWRPPAAP